MKERKSSVFDGILGENIVLASGAHLVNMALAVA